MKERPALAVLGTLMFALSPMPLAHPEAGLRVKGRPQLYDRAADRSADFTIAALTSVQDWWAEPWSTDAVRHLSFFRLSREKLRIVRERPLADEEAPIFGSVMVMGGGYVTLRIGEEKDCPTTVHHTVLDTGFGIPLAGNRVYFVAGKRGSPDELLFEFGIDPFLNGSGAVTVKRVRDSGFSELRTTFYTTHKGDAGSPAEVEFLAPLPKLGLSAPLSADPRPWLEGLGILRYSSELKAYAHWNW